ncbi:NUDIX domain-containing protein [Paracoccus spongiarum]|uniref:NUDIX domain-containing protein n=1 Tax=Paracoccus spongiarum TaxID=3064387 RepID=A0ABT9JH04_9RHOB|nr:NUDIX domain-containing protein [Paracoccus sp. 2205BS29-5]MDP5309063.1 NUDIX domain-containing protein [Paracoccus sp. 2205BS29-5]
MKNAVRAIAWSPAGLVLIRRDRPGIASYFVLPGGGVEPEDPTLEDALRRELNEEIGAAPERIRHLTTMDRRPEGLDKLEHFFECTIPLVGANFVGDEARDQGRGEYQLVTIHSRSELELINLLPISIKSLILANSKFEE